MSDACVSNGAEGKYLHAEVFGHDSQCVALRALGDKFVKSTHEIAFLCNGSMPNPFIECIIYQFVDGARRNLL